MTGADGGRSGWRSRVGPALGLVLLLVAVVLLWAFSDGPDDGVTNTEGPGVAAVSSAPDTGAPETSRAQPSQSRPAHSRPAQSRPAQSRPPSAPAVPARVTAILALIDAGQWPDAANAPGTQGGRTFGNYEGLLPTTGPDGRRLRFQEWDVNPKKPGRGRDAERIVTANDGSAWYTLDHYRSFTQIRGPSR
ncbi:putative guanyl-specific ribonuclease [Gordonia hirsuta DSM 44140 = NBRC 16056]|uniref:Putative guanyl-specific ribonuclease n=1 Tax=Gordonia hirsuta DSM 44140 = NBRC 16056 TaxID=1121927 RepID=L7L7X9_9ACTN|nr:ribonuclease domain-containing protein [Gordonia hirsuta]GAC57004.1 putative guanyl-specific ribonuclease [Gordonia hirsuta DSM 44140 = NBRC 16056]